MTAERWTSLAYGVATCGYGVYLHGPAMAVYAIGFMLLPLAAIWYGDELESFASGSRLDRPTPGIMIKIAGWALLLLAPLAVYAFHMRLGFAA